VIALVIALGLVIGSFLNVVIARVPDGRSLRGRSACPHCGAMIRAVDNIPLLSFAILRGRCRSCGLAIAWRYPVVEALTATAFIAAYLRSGALDFDFVVASALLAALIAITLIDLDHQIIPDVITLPGIVAGVISALVSPRITWMESLLGIGVCGGLFLLVIVASGGGMGGGDVKLGAMLGAFLGWKVGLFALLVAVVLGGVVAAALLVSGRKGRKDPIPFGPFLAAGGAIALLLGIPAFLLGS
jgi:leader peptidase (prepilin peptidase)/N-methyltransferase